MHHVVQCSAFCLMNGVINIWMEQIIALSNVSDVAAARARLIIAQEHVRTELIVAADCVNVGNKVNKDPTKLHKYCISDPWSDGAAIMRNKNYLEVKTISKAQRSKSNLSTNLSLAKLKQ